MALPTVLNPARDVIVRHLGDSAILIRLSTNRIYTFNSTAARVWALVSSYRTIAPIVDILNEEFDASRDTIGLEIDDFLRELLAEGLVADSIPDDSTSSIRTS
jgi:Coenzyme PQQ synthesis protein D (PqqD)